VARRLRETDSAEIRDAFGALSRVRSPADVERLVEESATLRSPGFLTALRRYHMRTMLEMTDEQQRQSLLNMPDEART
jgi:hypothetical protein